LRRLDGPIPGAATHPTHETDTHVAAVLVQARSTRSACAFHKPAKLFQCSIVQASEGGGALPLEGSIPDMTATTDLYLALQRIYRAQADAHVAAVHAHAHAILTELKRDTSIVSLDAARLFCKNARALRVVRFRPIAARARELSARALSKVRAHTLRLASSHLLAGSSQVALRVCTSSLRFECE
jgi:hypothetical protein